jgi:AcrR family transcriptional regulator
VLVRRIRTFSDNDTLVEDRRRQIAQTAAKLLIKKGYETVTTRELARGLHVSKGTLYHYVGSKEDVLYLVVHFALADQQEFIRRLRIETESMKPSDALWESVRMYFEQVDRLQDIYNLVNHAIVNLPRRDRLPLYVTETNNVAYFEELLRKGIQAGEFASNNVQLVAHDIVVSAHAWANRRWFLQRRYTLDQYTREYTEFLMSALRVASLPTVAQNRPDGNRNGFGGNKDSRAW